MIETVYGLAYGCTNNKAFDRCFKCGLCGREFDSNGFLTRRANYE